MPPGATWLALRDDQDDPTRGGSEPALALGEPPFLIAAYAAVAVWVSWVIAAFAAVAFVIWAADSRVRRRASH